MYNTIKKLKGTVKLKGDKSISHRLLMIASLINDKSTIRNLSTCEDVITTMECLRQCNIAINETMYETSIKGGTLASPEDVLDCKNSGTTARMMIGLLAGQKISSSFKGDSSLMQRPMKRIIEPLTAMLIKVKHNNNLLPISIDPNSVQPIDYNSYTNSAQVKSSLMFAALGTNKYSNIAYNKSTRDHTEKILHYLNFDISINDKIKIRKSTVNKGFLIEIPGDISNASFLIGACLIIPGSKITVKDVLYNKTRFGFIDVLLKMGANIKIINENTKNNPELYCDIIVEYTSDLKGVDIKGNEVIRMIDEIPILSIVATQANGQTVLMDATELKYKESNRLSLIYRNLKLMGANIKEEKDGLIINGNKKLYYTTTNHGNDHRIAMSFEVLHLLINNKMDNAYHDVIKISFPEFYELIEGLIQ